METIHYAHTNQPPFGPNFFKRPLNEVLGTKVKVRIIRFLINQKEGFLVSEIVRMIGVSSPGTRKAIKELELTGFIKQIGGGKRRLWLIREEEPLIPCLRAMFENEMV